MIYQLQVPATLEDNAAVRVLEWHGAPGDVFEIGDLIVEVETHKALIEIRAGQRGLLRQQVHSAGEWCGLGGLLAIFSDLPEEPLTGETQGLQVDFLIG